jgi:peroxiredoxin Q/BCP
VRCLVTRRNGEQAFKKAGAEIIGVSGDDPESHANFKSKLGLPYTLLADEGNKVGP